MFILYLSLSWLFIIGNRALRGITDSEITQKPERPVPGSVSVSSLSLGTGTESVEFPREQMPRNTSGLYSKSCVCVHARMLWSNSCAHFRWWKGRTVGMLCNALLGWFSAAATYRTSHSCSGSLGTRKEMGFGTERVRKMRENVGIGRNSLGPLGFVFLIW